MKPILILLIFLASQDAFGFQSQYHSAEKQATTQAAFEARTILYLLHGEEYPVLLPPMPAIINPALMQGVAINFKNTTFNLNNSDELVSKPYPNPVNGVLYLDTKLPNVEIVEFELYDIAGKLQYAQTLSGDAKHAKYFNKISLD